MHEHEVTGKQRRQECAKYKGGERHITTLSDTVPRSRRASQPLLVHNHAQEFQRILLNALQDCAAEPWEVCPV